MVYHDLSEEEWEAVKAMRAASAIVGVPMATYDISGMGAEIKRLRSAAARALERVQVEDSGEAEMILSQVVDLAGNPVREGQNVRDGRD